MQLSSVLPVSAEEANSPKKQDLELNAVSDLQLQNKIREKDELVGSLQQVIASLEEALQVQASQSEQKI